MDLSERELSGLFIAKGWEYGTTPLPAPRDIQSVIDGLVSRVRSSGGNGRTYAELGRFVVLRCSEFPNSAEVFLKIGFITDYPEEMDVPA